MTDQNFIGKKFNDEVIENELKALIEKHVLYTNSNRGKELLKDWANSLNNFVKVMPIEYKRALKRLETEEQMVEELTA